MRSTPLFTFHRFAPCTQKPNVCDHYVSGDFCPQTDARNRTPPTSAFANAAELEEAMEFLDMRNTFRKLIMGSALLLFAGLVMAQETVHIGMILPPEGDGPTGELARDALNGANFAIEEFGFNAMLYEVNLDVQIEHAGTPEEAVAAAERIADSEVAPIGIAGGFDTETTAALSAWAAENQVPFLNLVAPSDSLRGALCSPYTFHLAPSAAMYIDAIGGWYIRANFRDWFVVVGDDDESQALLARTRWMLANRHFGAEISNTVTMAPGDAGAAAEAAANSGSDVVVMLAPTDSQLEFLAAYEAAGAPITVTGFPWPEAQTRAFYLAAAEASPTVGAGNRATAWSATLDLYGARELNARYLARFDDPMQFAAWASYQAVKIFFEANTFAPGLRGEELREYMGAETTIYDLWKGIGSTFRPWDNQLRQPLHLVEIDPTSETELAVELLVGELPAIYLPGTDPVERLDQLGDLAANSSCNF